MTQRSASLAAGLIVFLPLVLVGNEIGAGLRYPDLGSAIVYPPYALLTAVLVLSPRRHWAWYILGSVATHLMSHQGEWPFTWMLGADVANSSRAVIAALLLTRFVPDLPRFSSVSGLCVFLAVAAVIAPSIGATLGAANAVLHHGSAGYWRSWGEWFVSNSLTGIAMLPAALVAFAPVLSMQAFHLDRDRLTEAAALVLALAMTSVLVFVVPAHHYLALPLYGPLPVLLWAALRFGVGAVSASVSAVTFAAIWSADRSAGQFVGAQPDDAILRLQIFVGFTAVPVLYLAVMATARRRAQLEIDEQRRELSHLSRVAVLGQLSGSFAHELNQPLTAILNDADVARQLISRQPADVQTVADILGDIKADGLRAAEVIHRLRDLHRRDEPSVESIDPKTLVGDVLALAHTELVARQVDASAAVDPLLPPFRGDKVQMQQLLLNLVLNGCEAMSARPAADRQLLLSVRHDGPGNLHFTIRDRGAGVPAHLIDRVFDPFVTTKADGLGLGLSISRTIVDAHGGRIWVENNPDAGATMHYVLPIAGAVQ